MSLKVQSNSGGGNRFSILNYEQVQRLIALMDTQVTLEGFRRFPAIQFPVIQLVKSLKRNLMDRGVTVRNTRLNGGAATHVVGGDAQNYNDVDIIFDVDLPNDAETLEHVRQVVFSTLDSFSQAETTNTTSTTTTNNNNNNNSTTNTNTNTTATTLEESETEDECASVVTAASTQSLSAAAIRRDAYIRKLIKVYNEQDRWSLIALANSNGKNVELKFVNKIRRPFEFTVDAFQVILDSLLSFYENNAQRRPLSLDYYPTVAAENVYGNYSEAHYHLQNKIIYTRDPEEIRGGGLLRFCRLVVEGYRPSEKLDVRLLQEFMCSRFFIDFPTLSEQEAKLRSYLDNHFPGVENHHEKYRYLLTLCHIVAESTICLMNYDRQQTISLILSLAQSILMEYQSTLPSACTYTMPMNQHLDYYRQFEQPPYSPHYLSNTRHSRNLRSRPISQSSQSQLFFAQAPRMRNRKLTPSSDEAAFVGQPALDNNMAISVL